MEVFLKLMLENDINQRFYTFFQVGFALYLLFPKTNLSLHTFLTQEKKFNSLELLNIILNN